MIEGGVYFIVGFIVGFIIGYAACAAVTVTIGRLRRR